MIMAGGGGTRFWPRSRQKNPSNFSNWAATDLSFNKLMKGWKLLFLLSACG
jgi:mannose-1-phosphate guanylyltransferase